MDAGATAPKVILGYWNTRALCEPLRLLLHHVGQPFEDHRYQVGAPPGYDKTCWTSQKEHLGLPFPNLPYYIEPRPGGAAPLRISQMHAILRHIGAGHALLGGTAEARARCDVAIEAARDWFYAFCDVTYCSGVPGVEGWAPPPSDDDASPHRAGEEQCVRLTAAFERGRGRYLTSTLPRWLERLGDAMLAAGGGPWVAGEELTVADFVVCEYLDQHLAFEPRCLDGDGAVARLRGLHKRFFELPNVARYRASAEFAAEPLHNRYSHFHRGWLPGTGTDTSQA